MKILALETGGTASTNIAVVAAVEIGGDEASVVVLGALDEPRALGAKLIGLVDETLEAAGWKLDDLNGLAIGSGPGSWTSLRVGFATFKTLAQIAELPLVAVPSFDALAVSAQRAWAFTARGKVRKGRDEARILLALSPCRPGEFYGKIFRVSSEYVAPAQAERIAPLRELLDTAYVQKFADQIDGPLLVCGAAAGEAAKLLTELGEWHEIIETEAAEIAIEIALSGASQIAEGEVLALDETLPLYLAPSNAERVLASKNGF